MRSASPQCARLLAVLLFAAGCGSRSAQSNHRRAQVTISGTCSVGQVRLAIIPSTVRFHHTNLLNPPTDVTWALDQNSTIDNVTIAPDSTWPFDGNPSPIPKGGTYTGVGKSNQDKAHYRYSATVTCNGTTVIFDPDIWVD